MNVSLAPKLEEFVRRQVATGRYNSASEVIREAIRLLIERDDGKADVGAGRPPAKAEIRARLAKLEKPLRERGLTSLALFGSLARDLARADSDIDILVDIDPKAHVSLVDLIAVRNFLAKRLGREVDVVTRTGIEPAIRDRVLSEAESVF